MANPHRGEVAFSAGGKDYKLSFSANALCELEDALDLSIHQIAERLGGLNIRIKYVRAALWAGLTDHQPGITIKEAGTILGEINVARAIELITEAFTRSHPEAADNDDRPPQPVQIPAKDGTGPAS